MEITDTYSFLKYYGRIKERTRRLFAYIPPDKMEWTYQSGKFTIGDQIRHLALIERYMYAENVQGNPSRYQGCGIKYAQGAEAITALYESLHKESLEVFEALGDQDLLRKCPTPGGVEITTWKWLRAMVEHEIHHRGQVYMYLSLLGVKTPPIFGLTSEEVIQNSKP